MSAEKTIDNYIPTVLNDSDGNVEFGYDRATVIKAMNENSKKEVFGFNKWVWENGWQRISSNKYRKDNILFGIKDETKTESELYDDFILHRSAEKINQDALRNN